MSKKTAVVICPGRGTYNKTELGYLHRYHQKYFDFVDSIDSYRRLRGQASVRELDGRKEFSPREHLSGENSAALIYACSYADFLSINRDEYEIVAVTGNSMGWYLACVCAGALNEEHGTHLINTMGSQMKDHIIGGQIIYPEVNEEWIQSAELSQIIDEKMREVNSLEGHEVYNSIFFGGYRIIGGNEEGLRRLMKTLPPREGRYPFRLMGNAAFHTPLLTEISTRAKTELGVNLFSRPRLSLIDGRGKIWNPYSTSLAELREYTLGHQVDKTYDFSKAVEVAVKEFAPDHLIITGPGMTMGGAVAQTLINRRLKPIHNKEDFKQMQARNPYLISMGDPDQRKLAIDDHLAVLSLP